MQARWTHGKSRRTEPGSDEDLDEEDVAHSSDEDARDSSVDFDEEAPEGADIAGAISFALLSDLQQQPVASDALPRDEESALLAVKDTSCVVCSEPAKYTCPGCFRRSCSLQCVKDHKLKFSCSGERNMGEVIPLKDFSSTTLSRDLHFIEDCHRVVQNCQKHFDHFWKYHYRALPPPLHALREAAKRRGVICQIVSEGLSKRDRNTSRYDKKSDTMIWRCEFEVHKKSGAFTVGTDWASERYLLKDIFNHAWEKKPKLASFHIQRGYNRAGSWISANASDGRDKQGGTAAPPASEKAEVDDDDDGLVPSALALLNREATLDEQRNKRRIEDFIVEASVRAASTAAGGTGYSILHRAERLGTRRVFHRLNLQATLHDNLRALFFVNEFPEFLVVFDDDLSNYTIATEKERLEIRESFRKRPREERPEVKAMEARPERPTRDAMTEEEVARTSRIPCRQFQRGQCQRSSEECPYLHCAPEDVPACKNMLYEGNCQLGARCSFSHTEQAIERARADYASRGRGRGRGRGSTRGGRGGSSFGHAPAASMIMHAQSAPAPAPPLGRYFQPPPFMMKPTNEPAPSLPQQASIPPFVPGQMLPPQPFYPSYRQV